MSNKPTNKLWQGRSSGEVEDIMIAMGESISLDIEMYREDISGSMAHARMLRNMGILTERELSDILNGLERVRSEIESGKMELRFELEDIHTHVEDRLIELIGDTAKKLHTARSRNDQVAVDTHLYVQRLSSELVTEIGKLCESLLTRAEESFEIVLPGYTHLQVAQPVRLSHHLMAHFWSFTRDLARFQSAAKSARRLPLGSGAMSGVNYENDREFLREELGFSDIYENSMDAVASRDHIFDYLHATSVFAVHASRMAEEIILWNSVEFRFISLPDSLTTGSSIMPQKKNPDLAELIRGKTGRVLSAQSNLLTTVKGLPFAYNRDLQEDRFPLLDAGKQCLLIVRALEAMVREMTFHGENMTRSLEDGYATATDLADALVQEKNIPFREAHHMVGRLVGLCDKHNVRLGNVSREIRKEAAEEFVDDAFYFKAVDLSASTDKKVSRGGTSLHRQKEQLNLAKNELQSLLSQGENNARTSIS